MSGAPNPVVLLVFVLLVGWRLVTRFRRNIGRQALRPRMLIYRICIYSFLVVLLGSVAMLVVHRLAVLAGMLEGVGLGAALAMYGLHLTRFESTPTGFFYTPNPYMGIGLSVLFAGRIAYRAVILSSAAAGSTAPHLLQSPLTTFLFGLLAGYYIAYYIGILVRSNETGRPVP